MQYDASQIKLKNIPKLENLEDGDCCRTYLYCFKDILPKQNEIDRMTQELGEKFYFFQDAFNISENTEIHTSIIIKRLEDYQALIIVMTTQPEESCVYVFGIHQIPLRLESVFSAIQSIQGQPREVWIY